MNILKSKKLIAGDTIGVVAPASPFILDENSDYSHYYEKGKHQLEKMGFKIKESKNLHKIEWWRAGSPKERAQDINDMFQDNEVKAIIANDGGNDCISVLEYIDYDSVNNNPKPFIGFSNITNIHSSLFSKTGLVGFHMGLLTYELGNIWPQDENLAFKYFNMTLTSTEPLGKIEPITKWENWRDGTAEGILFGGNLSMLDSLVGTEYFPKLEDLKGCIFFWELDNSATYRIERILTHLKYIGLFDIISGMIIGKLVDMKPSSKLPEPEIKDQILSILSKYNFPILANVDFGHKIPQIPMPIGVRSKLDTSNLSLDFLESAVK